MSFGIIGFAKGPGNILIIKGTIMQTIETEDKPSSLEKFLEVNSWEGGDGLKRFDAVSGKTVRTQTLSKYEEAR